LVNLFVGLKVTILEALLKALLFFELRKQKEVFKILNTYKQFPCPYQIASKFFREKGLDPYLYGETPLWSVYRLFKILNLPKNTQVMDLGAGDFKVSVFLNQVFDFQTIGVEYNPSFCEIGRRIKTIHQLKNFFIIEGNFLKEEAQVADVGFLFGSHLSDDEIKLMIDKIKKIKKVITVSFPLCDYDCDYKVEKVFTLPFLFGFTKVYINRKSYESTT